MKKITIALILITALSLCSAFIKGKGESEKAVERFLDDVVQGEVEKAYNELLTQTFLSQRVEAIEQQKQQTSRFFDTYGKLLGSELVKKQEFGKSVIRLIYILKCEKMPVVWEFYYYKADKDWQLISLKSRDNLDFLAEK
ncbi:MAG: hypothetical protein ACYTFK_12775 [Planctomycetota bacterium]|jgi:hypothetical protein